MFDQHTTDIFWRGDELGVWRLAKEYEAGKASLVDYAIALYNMRSYDGCASDLIILAPMLVTYSEKLCSKHKTCTSDGAHAYARETYALSAHLGWLSRQKVPGLTSQGLYHMAHCLCNKGIAVTVQYPHEFAGHHIPAHLRLNSARLALNTRQWGPARVRVREAMAIATHITDSRHRAQAFRTAGAVCRENGLEIWGRWLGLRALAVRNVPLDVHIKSMVALAAPSLAL